MRRVTPCYFAYRLLQDVSNITQGVCDSTIVKKKMVVTWGQSVHLGCFLKMPLVLNTHSVTWYHYSKEKGRYPIVYRPDKYILTSEHGLVIIAASEADSGRYDCWLGGALLCSYNITVDAHRCVAPGKSHDYQKQCSSRLNDSTNQNTHPNEIFHDSSLV
uniref:Ig-like domain-containing protein n=1 Tax=Timema douglasi TaxID=61478 RepID=A0A7R8VYX4_TIMDO|nr:unnamed protein product [Timema douglasi]